MKKIFLYTFLVIISVCSISCGSSKQVENNALSSWKRKQQNFFYKTAIQSNKDLMSLGIGKGENWQSAEEDAEFEARSNMVEIIKQYVKTMTTVYYEENNGKIDEYFETIISIESYGQIKPSQYIKIDKKKQGNNYYIALIAKKNREEYFNDYIPGYSEKIVKNQLPQKTIMLIDSVNNVFNKKLKEMNGEIIKKY